MQTTKPSHYIELGIIKNINLKTSNNISIILTATLPKVARKYSLFSNVLFKNFSYIKDILVHVILISRRYTLEIQLSDFYNCFMFSTLHYIMCACCDVDKSILILDKR